MSEKPVVALVLSGGSALGFAHVGVIEELLKNNIKIDLVVGTSMGAVVGAGFASGLTIDDLKQSSQKMNLSKFIDLNFKRGGIFSGKKISKLLANIYKVKNIEDCKIKFACVSTDIKTTKQYIAQKGDIVSAVRASMNIPGVFVPIELGDKLLIDGGILNNYPDDVAKDLGADIVIGVDVLKNYKYCHTHAKSSIDAIMNAFCLCNKRVQELKPNFTDVIIEPKQYDVFQMSFKKKLILKSIASGRIAAKQKMSEIKRVIDNWTAENKWCK